MDKMYRVFISSTYEDLQEERKEVIQALLGMDCIPTGMEIFQATDDDQWNLIKKVISSCDYYIVIVGGRYGTIHPQTGKSYTQMEYEYALEIGIPILGFVYKDIKQLLWKETDDISKLKKFVELIERKTVMFWRNSDDLAKNVLSSIHKIIQTHPRPGWMRDSNETIDTQYERPSIVSSPFIDMVSIDYWSDGLIEIANILFGNGIAAVSGFFDEKLSARLPQIGITSISHINIVFPSDSYNISFTVESPFYGIIVLCVKKDFWGNYIDNSYSALYELCSMFSGSFVTNLSDLVDSRVKIKKEHLLPPTLLSDNDTRVMSSVDSKLFVANQTFGFDRTSFEAFFLIGTSTIDKVINNILKTHEINLS